MGFVTAESQTNFAWIELGDLDEGEVVESLAKAGVAVRPGTPLGAPGHLRVTYGTHVENERFLAALRRRGLSSKVFDATKSRPSASMVRSCSTARTPTPPRAASRPARAPTSTFGDLARRPARGCL